MSVAKKTSEIFWRVPVVAEKLAFVQIVRVVHEIVAAFILIPVEPLSFDINHTFAVDIFTT